MSTGRAAAGGASPPPHAPDFEVLPREGGIIAACFVAMASPCELLLEIADADAAREIGRLAAQEAWRIETKFSRYRPDSIVSVINRSQGDEVVVDGETAALLDYAVHCQALSQGRFDITSGVLRRCWTFDGSDRLPEPAAIAALLPLIGFEKVRWESPRITLPAGMEIDFGGIGKEYAVDRVLALVTARFTGAALVNFGGDLAANRAPGAGPWQVGVERPDTDREARLLLELSRGGLATSGDTHRFLLRDGVRYGHILDRRSGWPVRDTPRSVTVAAASCVEAGMLATFAMLQGGSAESFLEEQGVRYWCLR
ncbi:MAG TPA: FAD:protein FMN transferase [Steroidobacteraceae bacterium]|nr:FAD:protein FMN transferase [Steroidobacteraceae bacterium]